MARNYDRVGPCLGAGGMGGVWAARVGEGNVGERTPGSAGSWVAVKAIPLELTPGDKDAGGIQSGLRECLSTFRDLSPVHVVRYERYWFEEPASLPAEIRAFCEFGRSQQEAPPAPVLAVLPRPGAQPPKAANLGGAESGAEDDADEEGEVTVASVCSLRFCDDGWGDELGGDFVHPVGRRGAGAGPRLSRTLSGYSFSAHMHSPLADSCGFVWEVASDSAEGAERSDRFGSHRGATGVADAADRSVEAGGQGAAAERGEVAGEERRQRRGPLVASGPRQRVVLLIEMELMGPPPEAAPTAAAEERSTLRTWLLLPHRMFSDVADVFGALMFSVRHIHRKRIVHADLKPDNIFCVVERSRVAAVRIGDFGLAGANQLFRQFSYGEYCRPLALGGTPGYVAPEILRRDRGSPSDPCPCSDKVDIYSCAVILLELLLEPFRTQMERAQALELCCDQKVLPDFISARLPKTRGLLLEMCEHDPSMRLSAEEVCKRFEKEVRKELCRSGTQLCCSPTFSLRRGARPGGAAAGVARAKGGDKTAAEATAAQTGCPPKAGHHVQGERGGQRKQVSKKGWRRV